MTELYNLILKDTRFQMMFPNYLSKILAIAFVILSAVIYSGCNDADYNLNEIKQRTEKFISQFHDFAKREFPIREFDPINHDYENGLFLHVALIEGRTFIHYVKIHKAIEEQKDSFPPHIKSDYITKRSQFIQKINHIFNDMNNLHDEYHLRDELENSYYDFIVPFVQKYADFLIQKITTQTWPRNIVGALESFAFWLRHPSETQSGMTNVSIKKPRIELPRIDILKTKNEQILLLVSNGCCGNLGVIPYQHTKNQFQLIPIRGQEPYFSVADVHLPKDCFYQWHQNTNILKTHKSYTNESLEYQFHENKRKPFFELKKVHPHRKVQNMRKNSK